MTTTTLPDSPQRTTGAAGLAPGLRRPARPGPALAVAAGRAAQARPAHALAQPGHVHRGDRRRLHHGARDRRPDGVRLADHGLALAHGRVRQPGRGGRRGPRQGPGRGAAPGPYRHRRPPADRLAARRRPGRGDRRAGAGTASCVQGDVVVVEAGETIPGDGDVVEGIASVDESAITGESAPVIRESGGDRSSVTGGTRVLSDRIVVRITQKPGESFIDRMIALVEGASRQKTPNEIALNILLAALTIIFLLAVATLQPLAVYSKLLQPAIPDTQTLTDNGVTGIVLVSLLVCLIPTTIGALLSAIGIAGMDRLVQRNVLAMSGRAVEAAGDVNTLLLDKTGTITLGNRQATGFLPLSGVSERRAGRRRAAVQHGRRDARGPLDRRVRQADVRLARAQPGRAAGRPDRAVHRADPDVRCGPVHCGRWPAGAQGRGQRGDRLGARARRHDPAADRRVRRRHLRLRRHPAGGRRAGRRDRPGARHHPAHRRGQAGHAAAVRRDAPDGHPHRDDHRRQPADREGDRRRGRRGRLPRRGHPGGQARADPAGAGGRQARRDDRRRHQRRAGAGPGRRRRGHEHRHVGRQGGRQHGRPRLRPDQAHRDRRDRQAAAHHPRLADHVLHRQRRREVLRDHPGDVRGPLPRPGQAQRDAAGQPRPRRSCPRSSSTRSSSSR